MFENEQKIITTHILEFCAQHELPDPGEVAWNPIPPYYRLNGCCYPLPVQNRMIDGIPKSTDRSFADLMLTRLQGLRAS